MSTRSPGSGPLGAQRPAFSSLPQFDTSAGREAVEFAASAGLFLDDWQAYVLEQSLGERSNGKWAASEVGLIVPRQNGKGAILEARELAGLFLFGEKLILHSAHEFKTAQEGFRRLRFLIENTDSLRKRVAKIVTSHGDEGIELTKPAGGGRLRFVARSRGSGRGFSGDCVILDEAYNLADAAMDALMPTLSARPNPQIIYTSSAPLLDSTVLRRLCLRGRAGQDTALAYFEWCSAAGLQPNDPEAWAQANPALGIRLDPEFVEREFAALSPEGFRRERLGIWEEHERSAILPGWSALADPSSEIPPRSALTFALDVAPSRAMSAIAVAGARSDGRTHVEIVDRRPETYWILDRFRALRDRWGRIRVVVDPRSAAGSLIEPLKVEPGIEVVETSPREVAEAAGRFFDACSTTVASLRHLNDPVLNAAVDAAITRPLGDAWAWDRRKPTEDITPLVAATLAFWGATLPTEAIDIATQVF